MAVAADPQTGLWETVIEDEEIERLLEEREKRANSARALRKKFEEADAAAKDRLNTLDLGEDATVRIGRFLVTLKAVAAKAVSFETSPTSRLQIKSLDDAGD